MRYKFYKVGALKRKFKLGRDAQEPGTFIKLFNNAKKATTQNARDLPAKEELAFKGLI